MGAYYVHGHLQQKPENRGRVLGPMELVFAEDCSQKREVFENQLNMHSYLFK